MKALSIAISAVALAGAGVALAAAEAPAPHNTMMGDKTVTRAEAEARARAAFDKLDVNHDGKIDKADREAKMAEKFKKVDTDGNGSISPAEFMASHERKPGGGMAMDHKMGGSKMGEGMEHPEGGMRGEKRGAMMGYVMLRMADTNKDGAVTRDEFIAAALAHFDKADANHDGKVTPEERQAAMKGMRGMNGPMGHPMGDGPPPPPSN